MSKVEKLFDRLMSGNSDANFPFDDLAQLLHRLGYMARQAKGSHIVFYRRDSFLNLQYGSDGKAKAYQVRQVRAELKRLNLNPS
jgi:hypothetical protein